MENKIKNILIISGSLLLITNSIYQSIVIYELKKDNVYLQNDIEMLSGEISDIKRDTKEINNEVYGNQEMKSEVENVQDILERHY